MLHHAQQSQTFRTLARLVRLARFAGLLDWLVIALDVSDCCTSDVDLVDWQVIADDEMDGRVMPEV
jgi:hypothetical protein